MKALADAASFSQFLETLSGLDFFTLVLPFVLSYVVFLFALRNVDVFSDDSFKGIPEIVSLIGAFFLAQYIATNPVYQAFFINYFGKLTIGVLGVLGVLIVLGMLGADANVLDDEWIQGLGVVLIVVAFVSSGGLGGIGLTLPFELGAAGEAANAFLESGWIWILLIGGVFAALSLPGGGGDQTTQTQDDPS